MKLALVVQRYGASVNGGAELHARYIAELLAKHHNVEALTTCASDYVTWRNELPAGTETLRGVTIRRFPVSRERDPRQFGLHSRQVFERRHSLADELSWLESEGPTSPAMIEYIRTHADDYDFWIFFSYRYYHAYHGARAVPHKAILVPTAERDAAVGLSLFGPLFRGVRALMYNSHEERAMIRAASQNDDLPGDIVGVGSDVPRTVSAERFRQKYDVQGPFLIYVGRIDENKGCRELFQFFSGYRPSLGQRLQLLLIGNSILPIPNHPNIRHLGYVTDQDKFDAIAASEALAMPSYYESLSMVALEAWALGKPVLANGHCDVLRGQCIRSRAGLYYENLQEFCETLFTLTTHRQLHEALGENGRRFYEQHYAWPVIERKYLDMLQRLKGEQPAAQMEPLPGWLSRRRRTLAPALSVLDTLPKGAAPENGVGAAAIATGTTDATAAATRASQTGAEPDRAGQSSIAQAGHAASAIGAESSSGAVSSRGALGAASGSGRSDRDQSARDPRDRAGRGTRDGREGREGRDRERDREQRGAREARGESRGARDDRAGGTKEASTGRDRDARDTRAPRDDRQPRESKEGRERRSGRAPRGDREARGPREGRDARPARGSDTRAPGDMREPADTGQRDASEPREPRETSEARAARGDRDSRSTRGRDARESGDTREPRDAREPADDGREREDRDTRTARGRDARESGDVSEPGGVSAPGDATDAPAPGDRPQERAREGNESRDGRAPRGDRRGRDRRPRDRDRDRRGARGQGAPADGTSGDGTPGERGREDGRRGDGSTGDRSQGPGQGQGQGQGQGPQGEGRSSDRGSSDRSPGDANPPDANDAQPPSGNRDEARRSSGRRGRGPRGRGRSGNRSDPGSSGSSGSGSSGSGSPGGGA